MKSPDSLIAQAYEKYRERVIGYINYRINDEEASRDLAQEVFLRMLEYSQLIYESAIENFIYTITRNIINDYLRRFYVRREYDRYMQDYATVADNSVEQNIIADDLAACELRFLEAMPRQRAAVYTLKRFEEMSAKEIADRLGMAVRTVENHYYIGVKQMRRSMAECI